MTRNTKIRILGLVLTVAMMGSAMPGWAADDFDPDKFLQNAAFKKELETLKTEADAQNSIMSHANKSFGISKTIFDFAAALADNKYTAQLEAIMDVPVQQWNPARGWNGSYDIINVKRIVQQNASQSLFGSVTDQMGNLATALSVYSVMKDASAAVKGDNNAKLKSIKTTYDVVSGYWATRIGWNSLSTAMIGVGVISFALDTFIAEAQTQYTDYWWTAYSQYLNGEYPQTVTGPKSWAALSKSGGEAAVMRRLNEFWDNPFENAVKYYGQSRINAPPAMADMQMRNKFAASYYYERLHKTLSTYFAMQAEDAKAKAYIKAQDAHVQMMLNLRDLEQLRLAILDAEDAEDEEEEMDRILAIRPPAKTVKEGESVTFVTVFLYEDASTVSATATTAFSGAASGPVFDATEVGTFTITATCEGLTADAVVIVEEKIGDDDEEDEIEEVIDEIKEPEDEDDCSTGSIAIKRASLAGRIARVKNLASTVRMYQAKFDKELADRAADPCGNSLLAYCYTQAGDAAGILDFQVDQIRDEATALIMTLALCPDVVNHAGEPVTFQSVIRDLATAGTARSEAKAALASMQARLGDNGCDEDEFTDLADQYTEDDQDPDEMQDGGTMGEIGGDGVDNDQDGLQEEDWTEVVGKNVTIVVYDSGNAKDDVFSLSVGGIGYLGLTPAGGLRTFGLDLAPGTYTATVGVVVAPDNCGTVTAIAMSNGVEIGALGTGESCPPVGAALTMIFTVPEE